MILLPLLILDAYSLQDIIVALILIGGGIFTLYKTVFKDLLTSSKDLLEIRTQERDDLRIENKDLKEENRLLRREINQRMQINFQDQRIISKLKGHEMQLDNEDDEE